MQPARSDLQSEIADRIASGQPCWFPGLAATLVEQFWAETQGLERHIYSTAAWLGEPAGSHAAIPAQPAMRIEEVPRFFARRFQPSNVGDSAAALAVGEALRCFGGFSAAGAVARLVRSIHCIASGGPGYDCSHSEPGIPFSVLVSVPVGERHAVLRLAESLLHEAMHLQLTLIERQAPIAHADGGSGFSPWQQTDRPVEGLLHGLYVFTAIHQWLSLLALVPQLDTEAEAYIARRCYDIAEEVGGMSALPAHPGLTELGKMLARHLLSAVLGEPGGSKAVWTSSQIASGSSAGR